ncbi:hypothetical protein PXH69_29085 [Rhodococcus qingshengii]|uniref:Uncharacterized protein n=1 Tax=Rhodococcus qingshengii TaxID=334542 RepID=A0AAW6LQP8_RHOSG|nr:hypothetical protein [Rhodococcus qingshengii]MDE8649034.1 hypothetical protein [Rhodococcus qingshengii]
MRAKTMGLDGFWENSDAALDKCAKAKTVTEIVDALNEHFDKSAGDAFFGGSGGDRQMLEVMYEAAGWTVYDVEAEYHFKARDSNGDSFEYCEGDVSRL